MTQYSVSRRTLLGSAFGMGAGFASFPAHADQPWQARLIRGAFDGKAHAAGLMITLDEGWKTYWRIPGSGGIAPVIDASGSNLKSFGFSCPLPKRFSVEGEETIGYDKEVVFPLKLEPADPLQAMKISISAFVGVCQVVCIPARFEATIEFATASPPPDDQAILASWQNRVPHPVGEGPVISATVTQFEGKPAIALALSEPVDDIFVEASESLYFRQPVFSQSRAVLVVDGAQDGAQLKGTVLRITLATAKGGFEQQVTVS